MKITINKSEVRTIVLLLFLIILFLPKNSVTTTSDSALRLCEALRISNGMELTWYHRGPGFPLLISLSYFLWGVSVHSAFLITRIFWALNIVAVFIFARKLFDRLTALVACLFVLFSYGINFTAGFITQDIVAPVWLLSCLILYFYGLERHRLKFFISSGILFGAAFVTKETVILYLLLPFLVFVHPAFRNKKALLGAGFFVVSFIATVIPWVAFVYIKTGHVGYLFGAASPELAPSNLSQHGLLHFIYVSFIARLVPNILTSYKLIVQDKVTLAPLLVLAVLFLLIRIVRYRKKEEFFLLLCLIPFLPIFVVIGARGGNVRQVIISLDLCYIILAYSVAAFVSYITSRLKACFSDGIKNWIVRHAKPLLFSVLLLIQLFNDKNPSYKLLAEGPARWYNMLINGKEFETRGRHTVCLKGACEWVRDHTTIGVKLLSSKSISDAVDFYMRLGYANNRLYIFKNYSILEDDIKNGVYKENERVLFIFPHPRFGGPFGKYQIIYFIFEKDLLDSLNDTESQYLMVSLKESVLKLYLDKVDWAQRVFKNDEVSIYRINTENIKPLSGFDMVTSDLFSSRLEPFKASYGDRYEQLEGILNYFSLEPSGLIENTYENFQQRWVENNISSGAKIAYSCDTGKCKIISVDSYDLSSLSDEADFDQLSLPYDYLFVNYDRAKRIAILSPSNTSSLCAPIKVFPRFYYMGDGWVIYELNKDGKDTPLE